MIRSLVLTSLAASLFVSSTATAEAIDSLVPAPLRSAVVDVPDESDVSPFIVGGIAATEVWKNDVPLIITPQGSCSGTFLSPSWVLTAAHCVSPRAEIRAGSTSRAALTSLGMATGFTHPLYESGSSTVRNDVGLYRLDAPSPLGSASIPLADYFDTWAWEPGMTVGALGWGATFAGGPLSNTLMFGSLQIVSDEYCERLDSAIGAVFDPSTAICAYRAGTSTCQGDSGGPLYAAIEGRIVQVGITSYGPSGCFGHTVAAWVPSALSWIRTTTGLPIGGTATPTTNPTVVRLFGADRYETGAAVASSWDTASTVFVATGANFPDSLAAGAAAARLGAPVLLVNPSSIPASTRFQLSRLRPLTVYVAGGPMAVSDAVMDEIRIVTGATVYRIGGRDRYETAELLTRLAWPGPHGGPMWVASGRDFQDPLIASAAAALYGEPFVLIDGQQPLRESTRALITSLQPSFVSALGPVEQIGPAVLADLATIAEVDVRNHPDPSTRSADVWADLEPTEWASFATSTNFPDALTAVPYSVLSPVSPLMIIPPNCVPGSVRSVIDRLGVTTIAIFGGPAAISPAVEALTPC